jgi:hypothetical protein
MSNSHGLTIRIPSQKKSAVFIPPALEVVLDTPTTTPVAELLGLVGLVGAGVIGVRFEVLLIKPPGFVALLGFVGL